LPPVLRVGLFTRPVAADEDVRYDNLTLDVP
jgi:hypothetical protein